MRRITIVFFCIALTWLPTGAHTTDEKDKLTAQDIITKHLAAIGGRDALAKVKTRVAIGTATKESDAAVTMAIMSQAPDRVSALYQFEGYNWQLIYDGSKSICKPIFSRTTSQVMQKYEDMLSTGTLFNDASLFNALLAGESSGLKFEAKGTKKIKGKNAYLVEMKRPKGAAVKLYFDTETFMWVRTEYGNVSLTKPMSTFSNERTSKDEETTYEFYVDTSDFKDVEGLKLPFRIEIVATTPILKQKNIGTIVAIIKEYRQNIEIDPKMFQ